MESKEIKIYTEIEYASLQLSNIMAKAREASQLNSGQGLFQQIREYNKYNDGRV